MNHLTFEQARARQAELENAVDVAGRALMRIPGISSGLMGLTPDSVRQTAEYQAAKRESVRAFAALREFNGWFVKFFKRELKAERDARNAKRENRA